MTDRRMRPLSYLRSDHESGARVGGRMPAVFNDVALRPDVQYFGTFPVLDRQLEFSIFHTLDPFGDDPGRDVIAFNNRVLLPGDVIWAWPHPPSPRGTREGRPFEARGLVIGGEAPDEFIDDDGTVLPFPNSKLGGVAHFVRYWLQSEVDPLNAEDFVHLLQIGMEGADLLDGFPWDPGVLHVWARDAAEPSTYRFMIEQ